MGHAVGDLACELFPGGTEIEFNPKDFSGMAAKTKQLIEEGGNVIYEATFRESGVFAMADKEVYFIPYQQVLSAIIVFFPSIHPYAFDLSD